MSVAVADAPSSAVKRKAGRPAKLKATPELVNKVRNYVLGGLSIDSGLILSGIPSGSMDHFLKQYPEAKEEFLKAEREFESRMVARLESASERDPKWVAWLLERRVGHRWAPMAKSEVSGPNGGPIQTLTLGKQLLATVAVGHDKVKREIPVGPGPKARPKLD